MDVKTDFQNNKEKWESLKKQALRRKWTANYGIFVNDNLNKSVKRMTNVVKILAIVSIVLYASFKFIIIPLIKTKFNNSPTKEILNLFTTSVSNFQNGNLKDITPNNDQEIKTDTFEALRDMKFTWKQDDDVPLTLVKGVDYCVIDD